MAREFRVDFKQTFPLRQKVLEAMPTIKFEVIPDDGDGPILKLQRERDTYTNESESAVIDFAVNPSCGISNLFALALKWDGNSATVETG
jgi:hypothetical protein